MPAPTRVDYQESNWTTVSNAAETTPSLSWQTGDRILVLGTTADSSVTLGTPTATGLIFSLVDSVVVGSNCIVYLWQAVAGSNGSGAISASPAGGSSARGIGAWVFRGSDGIGTPIKGSSSTAKTFSLTRTADNSAVIGITSDWNAAAVSTGITPAGTVDEASLSSGLYTVFVGDWGDQGAAGTTSYGYTGGGTPKNAYLFVEVKGTASGGATVALDGASAGSSSTSGDLAAARGLAATSAGTSTTSASVAVARPLAGTSAGTATTAGTLGLLVPLSGTSAGSSTSTGAISVAVALGASSAGTSTTSATLTAAWALGGSSTGSSSSTGTPTVVWALSGTSAGTSTTTGDLAGAGSVSLTGTSAGGATTTGSLGVQRPLTGTSAGSSTTTATTLVNLVPLAGTTAGASTSAGSVQITRGLAATSTGGSATTGALRAQYTLGGTSAGGATTVAALRAAWALNGTSAGSATTGATLTVRGLITEVGWLEGAAAAGITEGQGTATVLDGVAGATIIE